MIETKTIRAGVDALRDYLVATRRMLHENPEVSGEETSTAAFIAGEMKQLGMEPIWVRDRVAAGYLLDTGKPGKTVALRADIDALPIPEDGENLARAKAAVSKNEGVCHACGHDGHIAMLLGAARLLAQHRDLLCGRVLFLFESSEETGPHNTAPQLVELMVREGAQAVFGMHLYAMMPTGTISVQAGPRMSGAGSFRIEVVGRGGHASRPDQSINPVVAAAEIAAKLQSVVSLQIPPDEAAVLSVTGLEGGKTWNIIPDTCTVFGGIRYFSVHNFHKIADGIRTIVDSICQANGCTANYLSMPRLMLPVINHPDLSRVAEAAVDKILPGMRTEVPAWMASESFGRYQDAVPGVFAFVGIANEELGSGAAHHNAKFDLDEAALPVGVCAAVQFACEFLSQ